MIDWLIDWLIELSVLCNNTLSPSTFKPQDIDEHVHYGVSVILIPYCDLLVRERSALATIIADRRVVMWFCLSFCLSEVSLKCIFSGNSFIINAKIKVTLNTNVAGAL